MRQAAIRSSKMKERKDDVVFAQHGCRLIWALAKSSSAWPEELQAPAVAALMQMAMQWQVQPHPEARMYNSMALQAVAAMNTDGGPESVTSKAAAASPLLSMD
eukprot:TRINITY_DN2170_c0_g1_i6.p1 TRINITY_DN2170_c0_g1~~TRINITY_DN2170_c0_g1_i6.p1  ORF type:complete len:103 (-),score=21.04 TRINITY_DN2170_c0_g1_i6:244-552(-)